MERNRPATLTQGAAEALDRSIGVDVDSRRAALESLQAAILRAPCAGPILITGEPGAGKTRLWGRLADEAPSDWRFAVVQAASAVDAVGFLALTAAQLGVEPSDRLAANRLAVASALQDESTDGRSWALVVENVDQASREVWTEIEAMASEGAWGARRGFATILLVGRTELIRRLAGRPLRSIANSLAGHVHLPPLDVDEAARLLASVHPDRVSADRVERLHRDAAGNPRSLLRLAASRGLSHRPPATVPVRSESAPAALAGRPVEPASESPLRPAAVVAPPPLVPSRPPLREEEGLIEVGWSGSLGAEDDSAAEVDESDEPARPVAAPVLLAEEAIEDHYAALQAWTEWTRNRDRLESTQEPHRTAAAVEVDPEPSQDEDDAPDDDDAAGADLGAGLRAETEHDHAPYSQLFTRLGQPR